jgi:HK97 family phage major capsid protein
MHRLVAKEGSQAADTVVAANLLKMSTRMPQRNFARSVWLVNQDTLQALYQLNLEFKSGAGAGIAAGTPHADHHPAG